LGTSRDAILFSGYCWDEEEYSLWQADDDNKENEENEWEARYARAKGLLPPTTPFPQRVVTPTRENGWSSTPKDYTPAEQAIIDEYRAYWKAKMRLSQAAKC